MNYQQFIETIRDTLSLSFGENPKLQIHTALKNNGKERVGITFIDQNLRFSPTIYLEEYYSLFQDGYPIEEISDKILEVYREVNFDHGWNVDIIKNFEIIQSKIVYKLILSQKNETLLQNIPHMTYLDLAIVFYILFEEDDASTATITITNELMELWNTDLQTLYQVACQNAKELLPPTFNPMSVVIGELLGDECETILPDEEMMFVLSNPLRSFGATCILYDNVLRDIGNQLGENFYLLPSSIHEVIIVPESKCPSVKDLNDMVMEINETQIDIEEILSDHVYYYDCEKDELTAKSS